MTAHRPGSGTSPPLEREKEQRAWYWYDWANSAYVTTIATVLFSPYLTSVAEKSACGFVGDDDRKCTTNLHVLGLAVSPGSLVFYVVTLVDHLLRAGAADRRVPTPTAATTSGC